jgi:ribosome maturation factor RimP
LGVFLEVGRVPTFAFLGPEIMRVTLAGLRAMIEPGIRTLGFELVDVEYTRAGSQNVLRVYIDRPGGITVDHCATVSRQVSAVLDVEDPIPEAYVLEVSSPGLDRPLVKREDFERYAGETVKLRLLEAVEGRKNFKGTLVGVEGDAILVDVDKERFRLPMARIERARLVPRW